MAATVAEAESGLLRYAAVVAGSEIKRWMLGGSWFVLRAAGVDVKNLGAVDWLPAVAL